MREDQGQTNHASCPKCGEPIDPGTCWCGEPEQGHGYQNGHSFIPVGCKCHFPKKQSNRFHIDVRVSGDFVVGDMEWAQLLMKLKLFLDREAPHIQPYLEEYE